MSSKKIHPTLQSHTRFLLNRGVNILYNKYGSQLKILSPEMQHSLVTIQNILITPKATLNEGVIWYFNKIMVMFDQDEIIELKVDKNGIKRPYCRSHLRESQLKAKKKKLVNS